MAASAVAGRRWQLRWGADGHEVTSRLPGDELLTEPDLVATRAIAIRAHPTEVWPRVAQLGQNRGGFSSYDRLENLVGCRIHSSDRTVPEWQDVTVGDPVNLAPELALTVAIVDPRRPWCSPVGSPCPEPSAIASSTPTTTDERASDLPRPASSSQPGLGMILGARVLAEFGDDPNRYDDATCRKNHAGTSPITKASGEHRIVLARYARNKRLADACYPWAFAAIPASPGARAFYDQRRAAGDTHHRAYVRWATGSSGSSTAACDTTPPTTNTPPGGTASPSPLDTWNRGMSRP